jgi:hypothetical protein
MDLSQALLLLAIVLVLLLSVTPGGEIPDKPQPMRNKQLYHILIDRDRIPVLRVGNEWYPHDSGTFQSCYKIWSGAMRDGVFNRITISEEHREHLILQIDNRADGNCLLESMLLYMCARNLPPPEKNDTMVLRMQLLNKLEEFAKKNDLTGAYLQHEMKKMGKGAFTPHTHQQQEIDNMLRRDHGRTFDQLGYERYLHIRRQNSLSLSELEIAAFTAITNIVVRVYQRGESGEWTTIHPLPPSHVADNDPRKPLNPGVDEVWNADGTPMAFDVSHLNLGHVGPPGKDPNHYVLLAAAERVEVIT